MNSLIDLDTLAADILDTFEQPYTGTPELPLFAVHGQVLTATELFRIERQTANDYGSPLYLFIERPKPQPHTEMSRGEHQIALRYLAAAKEALMIGEFRMRALPAELVLSYRIPMAIVWPIQRGYELVQGYGQPQAVADLLASLPHREPIPTARRIPAFTPVYCYSEELKDYVEC
jgi:hypothetical protein